MKSTRQVSEVQAPHSHMVLPQRQDPGAFWNVLSEIPGQAVALTQLRGHSPSPSPTSQAESTLAMRPDRGFGTAVGLAKTHKEIPLQGNTF